MRVATIPLGMLDTNCHLVVDGTQAVAFDPGGDPAEVLEFLKAETLTLEAIHLTHFHFDHIGGAAALSAATGAPIFGPAADEVVLHSELGQGGFMGFPKIQKFSHIPITAGDVHILGRPCRVLHTPGHTPGSVCYCFDAERFCIVGDLIFYRSVGRSDFPGGDPKQLLDSIRGKILTLPDDFALYSGHGLATTVGDERLNNPFISDFRL